MFGMKRYIVGQIDTEGNLIEDEFVLAFSEKAVKKHYKRKHKNIIESNIVVGLNVKYTMEFKPPRSEANYKDYTHLTETVEAFSEADARSKYEVLLYEKHCLSAIRNKRVMKVKRKELVKL